MYTQRPLLWAQQLNKASCIIYGISIYKGTPNWKEYYTDITIFKKCSKQLVEYHNGSLKISLRKILNDYILLSNVFGGESLARIGFTLSNPLIYSELKTLLYFIRRLPHDIPEVHISSIPLHIEFLRSLKTI